MAKKEQAAFLLPKDQKEIIDELDNEEAGIIFKAIYQYEVEKIEPKLDKILKIVFKQFKVKLDNYDDAYEEKCMKNRQNIAKYWDSKKENSNEYDRIHSNTNVYKIKEKEKENKNKSKNKLKINENNSCYVISNDITNNKGNINIKEREKKERENLVATATTPTLEIISSYGLELGVDKKYCEKFFNHYESIGWVNGTGQKIKNWKLIFKNWIMRDEKCVEGKDIKKVGGSAFKL